MKSIIIITRDGWVYAIKDGESISFGDINTDVEIEDLRRFKNSNNILLKESITKMKESGHTTTEISRELGISRPTIYKYTKELKK